MFFAGGIEDDIRAEWARKKSQNRDTVNMVMQGLRQRGYAPDRKHFLPNETHPQVFRQVGSTRRRVFCTAELIQSVVYTV